MSSEESPDFVYLKWDPPKYGEDVRYDVQLSLQSDFSTILDSRTDIIKTNAKFQNLQPNTEYFVRVRSKNYLGESAWMTDSKKTEQEIPNVSDVNLREEENKHNQVIMTFDEITDYPKSDSPKPLYTLIRKYDEVIDLKTIQRERKLFDNKIFSDITKLDRTDKSLVDPDDKFEYVLVVKYKMSCAIDSI